MVPHYSDTPEKNKREPVQKCGPRFLKIGGAKGCKSVVRLLTPAATGNGEISSFGLELWNPATTGFR